ncbi:MAG: hypothetical protein NDI62_01510 [Burkholderiales bacterium]|nr:hypothetical protein [Burkholderiales bacterium]
MALSANEREEEFEKVLLMGIGLPCPKNMPIKELSKKSLEMIDKLLLSMQEIFDVSPDKGEQVRLAFIIRQLQEFKKEIEKNEFFVYLRFSYLAALSQGIMVYKREFKLI